MKRYNVSANHYNDSETVITVQVRGYRYGRRAAGKRVRVQQVFSKKKLTGPSQTRTHVPVYQPILGHGYGYRGYWARVHGYGLYPAGFSKPLG
jgi:hypothetical protein